jgi:hypothetical protein
VARTDLLGSLELAARAFTSAAQPRKILVIASDMVQDADGLNFERAPLDETARHKLLATLKSGGRIPSLSGVRVYVVGGGGPTLERARNIREFWLALFNEAGAELLPEHYGGPLLTFDM